MMSIVLESLGWLILGFAGLLVLVAYDRWEHRHRHGQTQSSGAIRGPASPSIG